MIGVSYNTQAIKTDVNGKPIPQYFNAQQDQYEALLGQDGAARAILYGPDGQPIGTSGNPLQVKAQDTDDALEQIKTALEALATEDKLEAVRLLLQTLDGKDFATQTTLAQVKQVLEALSGAVSTSSKQDALKTVVDDLKSELLLVKSELATIKANQLSGDQKVQLSGTKVVESAPVTGIKTVTSTVAEVFAGSSRKANRSKLVIRNLHQAVAIRIGGSGITDTIGQSLEPGASVEIDFSPSTAVSIYAVSTAGKVSVEVLEV